jgi:hypothetical protein
MNTQMVTLLIINNLNELTHNKLNLLIRKQSKHNYQSEQFSTQLFLFIHTQSEEDLSYQSEQMNT